MSNHQDQDFTNPYQFIDISEPPQGSEAERRALFGEYPRAGELHRTDIDLGALTHDRWLSDTDGYHTGHFACELVCETPLVLGADQIASPRDYTEVKPFRLNGRIALPASSLRGMLSSVAEIASGSAPRILDRRGLLSYRPHMQLSLSATARVIERETEGVRKLYLQPLTLPNFRVNTGGKIIEKESFFKKWGKIFSKVNVRIFFADGKNASQSLLKKFHNTLNENFKKNIRSDFYMKINIPQKEFNENLHLEALPSGEKFKFLLPYEGGGGLTLKTKEFGDDYLVIGMHTQKYPMDIPPEHDSEAHIRRGYVRVLRHENDTPNSKKYDLFLPEPEAGTTELELLPDVLAAFDRLARQAKKRADAERERELKKAKESGNTMNEGDYQTGRHPRNITPDQEGRFRPRHGDIVFFDVNDDGSHVTRISYSSAWRDYAYNGATADPGKGDPRPPVDIHDVFAAQEARAGRRLRPLTVDIPGATPETLDHPDADLGRLTRAEALFGFVLDAGREKNPDEATGKQTGGAAEPALLQTVGYAGRVHVGFASLLKEGIGDGDCLDQPTVLRILSSPKLPSPDLYFHEPGQSKPTATPLSTTTHRPNGVKLYVRDPHPEDDAHRNRWSSAVQNPLKDDARAQKLKVTPIRAKTHFRFKVHFENLTTAELELLAFTLRPSGEFRHKLGLGRGLGLGTVRISGVDLILEDRSARYADPFGDHRIPVSDKMMPTNLASAWQAKFTAVLPDTAAALLAIGQPLADEQPPVSHPATIEQGPNPELETFAWSSANKRAKPHERQVLGPVTQKQLCVLRRNTSESKGNTPAPRGPDTPSKPEKSQRPRDRSASAPRAERNQTLDKLGRGRRRPLTPPK